MRKPEIVIVGPQTFTIEFRNTNDDGMLNDGAHGYTLDQGNLIVIADDIHISKQKVVLLHEILHSARMVFEGTAPKKNAEFEEWEHYFIGIYETSILMIMRDNPDILDWLLES